MHDVAERLKLGREPLDWDSVFALRRLVAFDADMPEGAEANEAR